MRKNKWGITYVSIAIMTVLLNVAARCSTAFSDAYIQYILPMWVNTYGRFMGIFPFCVGEVQIGLGLLMAAGAAVLAIMMLVLFIVRTVRKVYRKKKLIQRLPVPEKMAAGAGMPVPDKMAAGAGMPVPEKMAAGAGMPVPEKMAAGAGMPEEVVTWTNLSVPGSKFLGFARKYFFCMAWILLIFFLVMTLNCFIMYHGSTFSEMYFQTEGEVYTLEDLITVRNFVVEQCNRLSEEVARDASGDIVYGGDIKAGSIECMQALGKTYSRLSGYYPRPKPLVMSDFHCQQYIQGYFYPFSMEANYNDVMYMINMPATMCHELAHLRGYILEDEANFIGFLACVNSDNLFFEYSGYLSVLNYLDNDFYHAIGKDRELYLEQPVILPQVTADNVFVTSEEWERIESKAWFRTETVDAVTDVLMDANLKANGVQDGMLSYSRVVGLVMQYYRQNGLQDGLLS